jgi:hypothetical protein
MESAGIRTYRKRSGPDRWNNRPGVDWVVADKAPTHCPPFDFTQGGESIEPRSERLGPWVLRTEIV